MNARLGIQQCGAWRKWLPVWVVAVMLGCPLSNGASAQEPREPAEAQSPKAQERPSRRPVTPRRVTTPESKPEQPAPTPEAEPEPEAREPQVDRKPGGVQIDPEIQRRIDELMEREAQQRMLRQTQQPVPDEATNPQPPARTQRQPVRPTGRQPATADPSLQPGLQPGTQLDTTGVPGSALNIPPTDITVPPEERTYGFSIRNGTYEQLVQGFARQTGLGVLGEAPPDGQVNFVTTEELSFQEALSRVRMLLFNYKPHEPYWLERREDHLAVVRVPDIPRILSRDRMFQTVEDFRMANLPADELALVIFTPTTGSLSELSLVRDHMPDYVRVTAVDGNRAAIFALVKDIEKYFSLVDFFGGRRGDPRIIERIDVQYTMPSLAVEKLRALMPATSTSGPTRTQVRRGQDPNPLETMPEPEFVILPDDSQGFILVRGMQDKIDEFRMLLPFVDVAPNTPDLKPTVIPVKHADPSVVVATIQQILGAGDPAAGATPQRPGSRRRSTRATSTTSVTAEDITLLVHPAGNAIIMLSQRPDADLYIRELVAKFDLPGSVGPVRLPLSFADPTELTTTITAVLGGATRSRPAAERFQLIADPSEAAIWFTGSESDLDRVKQMIASMDVSGSAVSLRIVRIEKQRPSFVASMLQQYDSGSAGAGASPSPPAGRGTRAQRVRRSAAVAGTKFTADDDNKKLFVLCTDDEWKVYEPIIEQLEGAIDTRPPFERIELAHVTPETAIERLSSMIAGMSGREGAVRLAPAERAVLVIGAEADQVDQIRAFIPEIDRSVDIVQRTFEIKHADPQEIKGAIESLAGESTGVSSPSPRRRRVGEGQPTMVNLSGGSSSSEVSVVQIGNRLVVRTSPAVMEQVAAIVAEFDVPLVNTVLRVYENFPPGADIDSISDMLSSYTSVSAMGGRPGRRGTADIQAAGPKFIPQSAAGKLIIIAEESAFEEIERLLAVLRSEVSFKPVVVKTLPVRNANVDELVTMIEPLLDMKIRRMVEAGELEPGADAAAAAVTPRAPRARQRVMTPGSDRQRYHMAADSRNKRIVMAATQEIVDIAATLVKEFDIAGESDEQIFRIVRLRHADAPSMVKAIREMAGAPARALPGGGRAAPTQTEDTTFSSLTITESPGGEAVTLKGTAEDVDKAEMWVRELDEQALNNREIRVYQIERADVERLVELIMNVVDAPATRPGARPVQQPQRPAGRAPFGGSDDAFVTNRTWTGQSLYIQADLISKTMIVSSDPARLAQVDTIVARFDSEEEKAVVTTPVPNVSITLEHADAFDASFALTDILKAQWDPANDVPKVESGLFGNYLIVRYHDASRFDEVRAIVRDIIDKPDPVKDRIVRKAYQPPGGLTAEQAAIWLKMRRPEVDIELVDVSERSNEDVFEIERVRPHRPTPCVLPGGLSRVPGALAAGLTALQDPEETPPPEEEAPPPPVEEAPIMEEEMEPIEPIDPEPMPADDLIRSAVRNLDKEDDGGKSAKDDDEDRPERKRSLDGEKLTIRYDSDKGVFMVEGRQGVIDEIDDWMDDLKKEIEDIYAPPDIRIYRVRYIDVFSAQEIIEEMFNATRQQRAAQQAAERQAMMVQRQQEVARQRQQQQQQAQQQQPGRGSAAQQQQQAQQLAQQQMQVPQLPAQAVRVYPNPRDRTLILRAETSQYPALLELLATIDQPKPIDSEMRIFKLDKLNAAEVEMVLKDMLGLEESKARATRARTTPGDAGAGNTLPRTLVQETVSGTGFLGIDPEDIKMSSNEQANTLVVMAPLVAIEFIGTMIEKLESEEMPERLSRHYELQHAEVQEVADYIASHFSELSPAPGGRPRAADRGAMGRSLNTPSVIPFPRLNMMTVLATEKQLEEIDTLVQRLDVASGKEQWDDITLTRADAAVVAETLGQMFSGQAPTGRGAARGAAASASTVPRFIGEAGGRILFFNAPEALHGQIHETVKRLEAEAEDRTRLRFVDLEHAKPSDVAEAINAALGSPTRRGGRGQAQADARFTITPADTLKRLFVRADDEMFTEIESLAQTLDKPRPLDFNLRIYPLQYANARQVHTQMTKLMTDYLRRLGPAARDAEAFSVEVDDKSNSLVVLGSPAVFGFLEENLKKIDTPANAASPPGFLMVAMKSADAAEVAQNITRLWSEKNLSAGETPPQAEANRSLNMLIVRGTQSQLDEIKREFVEPLEEQKPLGMQTETITLEHAQAVVVADAINGIFEDRRRAMQSLGARAGNISPLEYTVAVTPDVNAGQLIVQAGETSMALIKARVAELDREGAIAGATNIRIYPVKWADPNAVAQIIQQWERSRNQGAPRGRTPSAGDVVTAMAEASTQTVVVSASQTNHMIIEELISGLEDDSLGGARQRTRHVLPLTHADAATLANTFTQLFRNATRRGRADTGPTFVADPTSNALVADLNEEELEEIRKLLVQLDSEEAQQQIVRILNVVNAEAEAVARTLNDLFVRGGGRPGTAGPTISISAVQGTKSLMIRCKPEDFSRIQALVAELDSEEAAAGGEVRVVTLVNGDAAEMLAAMERYLQKPGGRGGRGAELIGDVRLSALAQSNAVVISGPGEQVEHVASVVRELDAAGQGANQPQIIPLTHARVGQVLPTLESMFADARSPRGRGQSPTVITGNEAINAIIVRGGPAEFSAIESVVKSLDTEEAAAKPNFRLVQLAQGVNVTDLADKVQTAINEGARAQAGSGPRGGPQVPSIMVTPDTRTNGLIVSGSPTLFDEAEKLARAMEAMGPAGGLKTRIIRVKNIRVDELQRVIDQLTGESGGTAAPGARRTTRPPAGSGTRQTRPQPGRRP